jgi:hypothetical protein
MTKFTNNEKEQIIILLKDKIPLGFSLNDSVDLQLENDNHQVCTINKDKIKILYLLIPNDSSTNIHEERVGRLCKKYDFQFGHYVKCVRTEKIITDISVSSEIDRLK